MAVAPRRITIQGKRADYLYSDGATYKRKN